MDSDSVDLHAKIRTIPASAGVYLYKNAEGDIIYVGKAKNLRSRVSSYFHEGRIVDAKTGTLVREAVDVDYIGRCLGPCVQGLTTPEAYQEAVRDVKLFLEGRPTDLSRSLRERMEKAAQAQEYERAAKYRDLISTVEQLQEKQRIAAVEGDDADVFGYHYENGMLAVNLFHMRGGRVLDRREFFWEDLPELESTSDHVGAGAPTRPAERRPAVSEPNAELWTGKDARHSIDLPVSSREDSFNPGEFLSALLKQLYIGQQYVQRDIY